MKIIELRAENIKRLKVVTIKPDGNLVEITGRNGQGKTSVLDAIWWALEGQKNIQAVPIRKGATSAKIKLNMGELIVTRTFGQAKDPKTKEPTGDFTTSIVVEDEKGARFPSPQTVIDGLLGALSFDPLAFTRMQPAEQLETLKQFVPGVDFAAIDRDNAADFASRTDVNRRAKEARAQEAGIAIPPDVPTAEIDEAGLTLKLESAGKHNAEIEARKMRRQGAAEGIERTKDQAAEKQRQIERLREDIEALESEAANLWASADESQKKLAGAEPLPEPISTEAIREQLDSAKKSNRVFIEAVRAKKQKAALSTNAESLEQLSIALTEAMDIRKLEKAQAIASAKLPIDGLGFGNATVLLNGIPFEQASDAERLRASIGIAAAMNPKLRVIRVRDGSLLDQDAMTLLANFADTNDLQVWIERVDSSGRVGFVLEDGEIASKLVEEDMRQREVSQ